MLHLFKRTVSPFWSSLKNSQQRFLRGKHKITFLFLVTMIFRTGTFARITPQGSMYLKTTKDNDNDKEAGKDSYKDI